MLTTDQLIKKKLFTIKFIVSKKREPFYSIDVNLFMQ